MKFKIIALGFISALSLSLPAHAQFGGMSVPGVGGGSSAPAVDTDAIKKLFNSAFSTMAYANGKYAESVGNDSMAAQFKEIGDKLKSGSLGVSSDSLGQFKTASAQLDAEVKKNLDEKTKMSDANKKALAEGMKLQAAASLEFYVGLKLFKKALESKNVMAISALSSFKDFPTAAMQWISGWGTIVTLGSSNGVDSKVADSAIKNAMKDNG
jgi:hypothetical protein